MYESLTVKKFKELNEVYSEVLKKLESVKGKLDKYDRSWNEQVYSKWNDLEQKCQRYIVEKPLLGEFETRCSKCKLQLHDANSAIAMVSQILMEIDVLETEINTSNPNKTGNNAIAQLQKQPSQSTPISVSPVLVPKERKLKGQLPLGKMSVTEYKRWLMSQLAMLSQFEASDVLRFDI